MSLKIQCPSCRASFTVSDEIRGKKVRCNKCDEVFVVPQKKAAAAEKVEEIEEVKPPKEERLQSRPGRVPPPSRSRRVEDDEDERPSRSRRVEDDEDERPSRSRRVEDDEDERPKRRKKGGTGKKSSALTLALIGVSALFVLLLGVSVVVALFLIRGKSPTSTTDKVAVAPPGNSIQPANPVQPPANPVQPPVPQPENPVQPPAQPVNPVQPAPQDPPRQPPPAGGGNLIQPDALRYRWEGAPFAYKVHFDMETDQFTNTQDGTCGIQVQRHAPARVAPPEEHHGTGTGFVVNANGYLITCAHVVTDAIKVEATLGGQKYPATVLARDDQHDLALLKIAAQNLPTVPLADSETGQVGQEVRAVGFPMSTVLGENVKVTRGTISGINTKEGQKIFQVDAPINPGNSGGPLVTESGMVLGVTNAKLAGEAVSNVGFAVPSNEAGRLLTSKGVTYQTRGNTAKLEGPALVQAVSPAVALLNVTMVISQDPNTYRLVCRSQLVEARKSKPGAPASSGGSSSNASSVIVMDGGGRILQAQGGLLLRFFGEVGQFLIEPLPPDARPKWETHSAYTVEIGNSSPGPGAFPGGPFMPRLPRMPGSPFGPRGPFGPRVPRLPRAPSGGPVQTLHLVERCVFTRGAAVGGVVTIQKHLDLKSEGGSAPVKLEIVGDGQIAFDIKAGMPRSYDFKATSTVTPAPTNVPVRIPISVSFKLLEGAEREVALNPPPPPRVGPKSAREMDLTELLAELKKPQTNRYGEVLERLWRMRIDPARRVEVAQVLQPILEVEDNGIRSLCLRSPGGLGQQGQRSGHGEVPQQSERSR